MASTGKLIPVTKKFSVDLRNDPQTAQVTYVDFARGGVAGGDSGLSDFYGKSIRQGNSFRVRKIDFGLEPQENMENNPDVGLAISSQMQYVPTTKHTKKAWNMAFKQWRAQKNLSGLVGIHTKYDDMEFAYDGNDPDLGLPGVISTLNHGGIGDTNEEQMVLLGNSVDGNFWSLQDKYNSSFPVPSESLDPETSVRTKTRKYNTFWPPKQELQGYANFSGTHSENNILTVDFDFLHGGNAQQTAWEGCVDILCGKMKLFTYTMPADSPGGLEDSMEVTVTFWIESFTPLVYKKKTYKKTYSKSRGRYNNRYRRPMRRSYTRRRRYGRRRYY